VILVHEFIKKLYNFSNGFVKELTLCKALCCFCRHQMGSSLMKRRLLVRISFSSYTNVLKKKKKKRIHFFFWLECNSCSAYVNGFKNILYVKIKRKKTTMREGGSKSAPSFSLLPLLLPAPTLPLPYFFIVLCRSSPSPIVVDAC
jgi:hypothetical protein